MVPKVIVCLILISYIAELRHSWKKGERSDLAKNLAVFTVGLSLFIGQWLGIPFSSPFQWIEPIFAPIAQTIEALLY